jgi:hypothetical protein
VNRHVSQLHSIHIKLGTWDSTRRRVHIGCDVESLREIEVVTAANTNNIVFEDVTPYSLVGTCGSLDVSEELVVYIFKQKLHHCS